MNQVKQLIKLKENEVCEEIRNNSDLCEKIGKLMQQLGKEIYNLKRDFYKLKQVKTPTTMLRNK